MKLRYRARLRSRMASIIDCAGSDYAGSDCAVDREVGPYAAPADPPRSPAPSASEPGASASPASASPASASPDPEPTDSASPASRRTASGSTNAPSSSPRAERWRAWRQRWQTTNGTLYEGPVTRVRMENGKVKVAVDSPYVNYRYDDPYVQVEIGDRRP